MTKRKSKSTRTAKTKRGAAPAIVPPALAKGEKYAGITLDAKGVPLQHVVLLPGELEAGTWSEALDFASKLKGDLPTRREQSLLFASCKQHFKPEWYWSCEPYAGDESYAWSQYFSYGDQITSRKHYELRARAVRRVSI